MKLCRDCRWFDDNDGTCRHDSSSYIEMIYGKKEYHNARVMRAGHVPTDCGKEAQFFQPKLSEAA